MGGQVERQLEDLNAVLRDSPAFSIPRALAEPRQTAIDAEINRWEQRSRTDPDARLVLRAFLGMRGLLWEVEIRSDDAGGPPEPRTTAKTSPRAHKAARPERNRVQRFKLED